MADPPLHRDADDGTGVEPGRAPTTGMPRWVKVFLIILILIVVAVIVSLIAGVQHGPRLH
jgi:hypothetical protein